MLRNLLDEVRNRRVLALAALGVLVALALPLLFLKGAPEGAPEANSAAPAVAKPAKLPPRAARLLATTDAGTAAGQAKGAAEDPFGPVVREPAATASATAAATRTTPASTSPASTSPTSPAAGGGSAPNATVVGPKTATTTPATNHNKNPSTRRRAVKLTASNASVDIRFGPKAGTRLRRAIPRQKALYIHGKLVAMFVKYSPSRKAAVFALAPNLHMPGPVACRVQDGSCRYVDIPAGGHAWITTLTPSGIVVSRRLDVVRIKRRSASATARAIVTRDSDETRCLLRRLVGQQSGDAPLDRDACLRT